MHFWKGREGIAAGGENVSRGHENQVGRGEEGQSGRVCEPHRGLCAGRCLGIGLPWVDLHFKIILTALWKEQGLEGGTS